MVLPVGTRPAEAAQSAAVPEAYAPVPGSQGMAPNVADPNQLAPVPVAPPVGSYPAPPALPVQAPAPVAEPPAQVPPAPVGVTLTPQQHQALLQAAQERDQFRQTFETFQAQQRQQQLDGQRMTVRQQTLNQAKAAALNMTPEEGADYLLRAANQVIDAETGLVTQTAQQTLRQQEAEMDARLKPILAPLYAEKLAKDHGLRPEFTDRLKMYPAEYMDQVVAAIKHEQETYDRGAGAVNQLGTQIQQVQRGYAADQAAATGIHQPAMPGVPIGGTPPQSNVEPGSIAHLMSDPRIASIFGHRQR